MFQSFKRANVADKQGTAQTMSQLVQQQEDAAMLIVEFLLKTYGAAREVVSLHRFGYVCILNLPVANVKENR